MSDRIFQWPESRPITRRKTTTGIAIHCTATREGRHYDATTVDQWHKDLKWAGIGYHYLIRLDGTIEAGRPEDAVGSHIAGHNSNTVAVVYVGGLDAAGKPKDTRTPEQKAALKQLVTHLAAKYRKTLTKIGGHRDWSPDKNRNGVIDKHEWLKDCPCFDVVAWCQQVGIANV
jgi:N-acetyl-anhydromuramyl-L-alanine amidase AmpD